MLSKNINAILGFLSLQLDISNGTALIHKCNPNLATANIFNCLWLLLLLTGLSSYFIGSLVYNWSTLVNGIHYFIINSITMNPHYILL